MYMYALDQITPGSFIALLVALLTSSIEYPPSVVSALKTIAASLVPVVMVAIGFQLKLVIPRDYLTPLGVGLTLKLIAAPLAAPETVTVLPPNSACRTDCL